MRILYAWEIGTHFGHIRRYFPIAELLRSQGVELSYALCDLSWANFLRTSKTIRLYQAPSQTRPGNQQRNNKSYPQMLFNHGFNDPKVISLRLLAWKRLLECDQPDLVICDLAPVAQWAAQCMKIPAVNIGSGFECPPVASPMPMVIGTDPASISEAYADERLINGVIETVCKNEGLETSTIQSQLHGLAGSLLVTYPELDPYFPRENARYFGSWTGMLESEVAAHESQATIASPDIFCYLIFQPGIDFVLGTLAGLDLKTTAYVHGVPDDFIDWLRAPNMHFVRSPIDLHKIVSTAQVAITNCNHGTTSFLVSKGVPVVMMPLHIEQWAHALRIQMSNLGRIVELNKLALFPKTLKQMLEDVEIRKCTRDFAQRAALLEDSVPSIASFLMDILKNQR
jgi:UDP:flavonoid glycosyltransferase YjiC (YdhE family)